MIKIRGVFGDHVAIFILVALILFLLCFAVLRERTVGSNTSSQNAGYSKGIGHYTIVVIDGCEYIYKDDNGYQQGPIFTHKGNCNNPVHQNKK